MDSLNRSALALRAPLVLVAVCLACFSFGANVASAGIFHWGDLSDPAGEVTFLDVEEDNGFNSPLFAPEPGMGGPIAVGNSLLLDPQNFLSQSSGGSNLIDSEFSTTLMVDLGSSIDEIVVNEFGDFTLGGLPGGAATAQVGASFFWQVLEIEGSAVNMPVQTANLTVSTGAGPHGGIYDLPGDAGIATPWEGSVAIDVEGFLATNLIDGDATKVRLIFDNTLLTAADDFSSAFIKKKGVGIDVHVHHDVPEPAGALLLGIGLSLLGVSRQRIGRDRS